MKGGGNMTIKEIKEKGYKKITFDDMISFIEENFEGKELAKAKQEFTEWAMETSKAKDEDKKDKYNHLAVKKLFCEKYAPEIVPKKTKESIDRLAFIKEWANK